MRTRRELREEVGRVFRMYQGTATAGGMNFITDPALHRFDSAYWVGAQVYILDAGNGGPNEATSWVSAFDRQGTTLTVAPEFWAIISAGTIYQMFRWVTKEEIDGALAEAVRGAEVATSLVPKADSLDYYLDGAMGLSRRAQVTGAYVRPHGSVREPAVSLQGWTIEEAEGLLTLRLPFTLHSDDGLWITYAADENYLTFDSQTVNLPVPLVVGRAVVYLLRRLLVDQDAGGQERFGQLLRYYEDVLTREEHRFQPPARRARVTDWEHLPGRRGLTGTPLE